MPKLTPGIYEANPIDWGMGESKTGSVYGFIKFSVTTDEGSVDATKFLHFTEKAKEFSYKVLKTCGFNGNMDEFSLGIKAGALRVDNAVQVVCKDEDDGKGGTICRIAYVNGIGEEGGGKRVDAVNAKAKLGFDFGAEMRNLGMVEPEKKEAADDIPF